jgi:hypothetical protein
MILVMVLTGSTAANSVTILAVVSGLLTVTIEVSTKEGGALSMEVDLGTSQESI